MKEGKMLKSETKRISGISRFVGTSFYYMSVFAFSNHRERKEERRLDDCVHLQQSQQRRVYFSFWRLFTKKFLGRMIRGKM